jgi:hypothetical protein
MADEWFIARDKTKDGPYSTAQLKNLASQGRIQPTDMLTKDGMGKWVLASRIKGLLPATQAPSPPRAGLPLDHLRLPDDYQPEQTTPRSPPMLRPSPVAEVEESIAEVQKVTAATELEEIIAEVRSTYQGGHPSFSQSATGILRLGSRALSFASTEPRWNVTIQLKNLKDILEPVTGEFPEEMVKRSQTKQTVAKVGKFAAGFAGSMIGGIAGKLVKGAGSTGAQAMKESTTLGPPPKNRLGIHLLDGGTRHKLVFDVVAPSKEEMEQEALMFWRGVAKVRHLMSGTTTSHDRTPVALKGATTSDRVFQVLRNGTVSAPMSADEIHKQLASQTLSPTDLICIEAWIPLRVFADLGGASNPAVDTSRSGDKGNLDLSISVSHHDTAHSETHFSDGAETVEDYDDADDEGDMDAHNEDSDEGMGAHDIAAADEEDMDSDDNDTYDADDD